MSASTLLSSSRSTFFPSATSLLSSSHSGTSTHTHSSSSQLPSAPPGSPPTRDFSGPWFRTSWILSVTIGLLSFLWFCILRLRWKKVYAGRALLRERAEKTGAHERRTNGNGGDSGEWPSLDQSRVGSLYGDHRSQRSDDDEPRGNDDARERREREQERDRIRVNDQDRNAWSNTNDSRPPNPENNPTITLNDDLLHIQKEEEGGLISDPALLITNYHTSLFGWILPTLRVPDSVMLQSVGLDGLVLLDFLKTSFFFFAICSATAMLVLMPINLTTNGSTDSDRPGEGGNPDGRDDGDDGDGDDVHYYQALGRLTRRAVNVITRGVIRQNLQGDPPIPLPPLGSGKPNPTLGDFLLDPETSNTLHLLFTYFFSLLALYMLHKNFHRFLSARQSYALARKDTVPARTVLVSNIPPELRGEHELKEYFEKECGWKVDPVQGVRVVRDVGKELKDALRERQEALQGLEAAWWRYKGGKGKGEIRLEGAEDGEDAGEGQEGNEDPAQDINETTEERRPATPAKKSSTPVRGVQTQSYVPENAWDSSPNWDEVRPRSPKAKTPQHESLSETRDDTVDLDVPASTNGNGSPPVRSISSDPERPSKWVPTDRLQKALPFLGDKVDTLDYWQDRFDAADAKVRILRKNHGGEVAQGMETREGEEDAAENEPLTGNEQDLESGHKEWKATNEAFVTFESISHAVSRMVRSGRTV